MPHTTPPLTQVCLLPGCIRHVHTHTQAKSIRSKVKKRNRAEMRKKYGVPHEAQVQAKCTARLQESVKFHSGECDSLNEHCTVFARGGTPVKWSRRWRSVPFVPYRLHAAPVELSPRLNVRQRRHAPTHASEILCLPIPHRPPVTATAAASAIAAVAAVVARATAAIAAAAAGPGVAKLKVLLDKAQAANPLVPDVPRHGYTFRHPYARTTSGVTTRGTGAVPAAAAAAAAAEAMELALEDSPVAARGEAQLEAEAEQVSCKDKGYALQCRICSVGIFTDFFTARRLGWSVLARSCR
jgi:Protein of unknown function (DUF2423)